MILDWSADETTECPLEWAKAARAIHVSGVTQQYERFCKFNAGRELPMHLGRVLWDRWIRMSRKELIQVEKPQPRALKPHVWPEGEREATKEESLAALAEIARLMAGFGRGGFVDGGDGRCGTWQRDERPAGGHVRCSLPTGHDGSHIARNGDQPLSWRDKLPGAATEPARAHEAEGTNAGQAEDGGDYFTMRDL